MANEKRLIDPEKFMQWLVKRFKCVPLIGSCDNDSESVKLLLTQAPTVDAVEVVHSEWTLVIDENDCECIECPLCGEQFYDGDNDTFDKPYNYCPNCGAKMDGDGDVGNE